MISALIVFALIRSLCFILLRVCSFSYTFAVLFPLSHYLYSQLLSCILPRDSKWVCGRLMTYHMTHDKRQESGMNINQIQIGHEFSLTADWFFLYIERLCSRRNNDISQTIYIVLTVGFWLLYDLCFGRFSNRSSCFSFHSLIIIIIVIVWVFQSCWMYRVHIALVYGRTHTTTPTITYKSSYQ